MKQDAYAAAGVSIDAAVQAKERIKELAKATFTPGVLGGPGFFGGMFELPSGFNKPVLVSSCDGVGTKLKIAAAMGKHDTVGIDIVNHSVDDILTCGAEPLFFLDYIAMGKLDPVIVADVVKGLSMACQEVSCALVGGETAEMPGLYHGNDYDLAGFIVGIVEKDRILHGRSIRPGDAVLGLPSTGLHTNGYSLARNVLGESPSAMAARYSTLDTPVGEALLKPHRSYLADLKPVLGDVKGLAHITGGGFTDNIPRTLPPGTAVRISKGAWEVLPIFELIQKIGGVAEAEMYRVFNMGIGMVVFADPSKVAALMQSMPEAKIIGEVAADTGGGRVILE
ncbi:phosphoribosylformylglycinamidine cyclo-ligase [Dehalogenimonas alkenigignens]|nr:phosphoribosylformylglycinamidine cyclo-ligase [Dehalogenimonas alkenigignens]PVV82883.1 phosphoribosylformylglycinamidine cyclo-ligase [Dehalogenimonas alkenigignens]